jgi:threonine-phosphate decarboxylase
LLDFAVSINPLGPPPSVVAALRRALALPAGDHVCPPALAGYPDPDCTELTAALARRHGLGPSQVVVGNGANDLLYAAARALRPRRAAIVEPTYTEYLRASGAAWAAAEHWLPKAGALEPRTFEPGGADLVWLGNPNNPTGWLWPRGRLAAWVEAHPQTIFVVDEAFMPFRPDEADHSLIPAVHRLANLIVVRSLTKVYTLCGLRLGYVVAGQPLAARLRGEVVPWSVNALAQVAGLAALEDDAFLPRTHAWFREEAESFASRLGACSPRLEPVPSAANFALVRLNGITAGRLAAELLRTGFAVRDASNFIGLDERFVRVAVRSAEDNQRLLAALHTALERQG